jgi:hypothetical protein
MKAWIVFLIGMEVLVMNARPLEASSPARQTIRVFCPDMWGDAPSAALRSLCQQMVQSLSAVAPRAALRHVQLANLDPQRSTDFSVRLHVDRDGARSGPNAGAVSLIWQAGPQAAPQSGPARIVDARLLNAGPPAHRAFMDDLVAASRDMVVALTR